MTNNLAVPPGFTGPPVADRLTAKEFIRSQGKDPGQYSSDALKTFGALAARLGRQEGWEESKKPEEGFTVHTWPGSVWEAIVRGERGEAGPATRRQIGYIMILACQLGVQSRAMDRLTDPIDQDQAGEMINRLKARINDRNNERVRF